MIYQISKLTVLLGMVIFLPLHVYAQNNFYAYHTKLSHTSTDYFGKYIYPSNQLCPEMENTFGGLPD
jgi:hypothetical protein